MTLTETATLTKKILLFSLIFFVVITSAWLGYQYYRAYQASKTPKPEEIPDLRFGVLPKPNIASKVPSSNFAYSLDTQTGGLPQNLPKIIKVYFIPQLGTTLLAPEKASELAKDLKFPNGPEALSQNKYQFRSASGKLIIDISSGNFSLEREVSTESGSLQDDIIADKKDLAENFKRYLSEKGLLYDELKGFRNRVEYNNIAQKNATQAAIYVWQDDVNDYPIITESFTKGLIEGVLSRFRNEENRYLKLKYVFWPIDKNNSATYPIITADEAFNKLNSGSGIVLLEPKNNRVSITTVYIAYFLTEEYTPYLEPYFVFEGDQFAAIVPAISPIQSSDTPSQPKP